MKDSELQKINKAISDETVKRLHLGHVAAHELQDQIGKLKPEDYTSSIHKQMTARVSALNAAAKQAVAATVRQAFLIKVIQMGLPEGRD